MNKIKYFRPGIPTILDVGCLILGWLVEMFSNPYSGCIFVFKWKLYEHSIRYIHYS